MWVIFFWVSVSVSLCKTKMMQKANANHNGTNEHTKWISNIQRQCICDKRALHSFVEHTPYKIVMEKTRTQKWENGKMTSTKCIENSSHKCTSHTANKQQINQWICVIAIVIRYIRSFSLHFYSPLFSHVREMIFLRFLLLSWLFTISNGFCNFAHIMLICIATLRG